VDRLPAITLSCLEEADGTISYVPIDPTQPAIMAMRIARQEGIPIEFIDWSTASFEPRRVLFPDPFALRHLSLEKYSAALLPTLKRPEGQHDQRARWMGYRLNHLEMDYSNIVLLCSLLDWPWIKEAYDERRPYDAPEKTGPLPQLYNVSKSSLFFALSEFPYVTYLYEKSRENLKSDRDVAIDGVKEILLRARDLFLRKHKVRYHNLTTQAFQVFLQYSRNLTLMESRLTPDLYTLVTAAKQIGGDAFAISVLEAAREYPLQKDNDSLEALELGIDQALFDAEAGPVSMKNRLSEIALEWRSLDLKPEPDIEKKTE
jgi:hypothetical protein